MIVCCDIFTIKGVRKRSLFITLEIPVEIGCLQKMSLRTPFLHDYDSYRFLMSIIKGGVVSVVGCSGLNTDRSIMKTKFAEDCGVDAAMNVIPFYTKITRDECIKFWNDLAKACSNIGLIVYNNPETTKFLVDAEILREIAKIPSVAI